MSQSFKQMQHGNEARSALHERLAREELGNEAYDKAASYTDGRSIKIFGIVFIAMMALAVLAATALGY